MKRNFSSVTFYLGGRGQFVVVLNLVDSKECIMVDYGHKTQDKAKRVFKKYLFVFCELGNKKAYKLTKGCKVNSLTGMTPILSIR